MVLKLVESDDNASELSSCHTLKENVGGQKSK